MPKHKANQQRMLNCNNYNDFFSEELMKKEQVSKLQQQFPQFDFSKVDLKNSNFNFNGDK